MGVAPDDRLVICMRRRRWAGRAWRTCAFGVLASETRGGTVPTWFPEKRHVARIIRAATVLLIVGLFLLDRPAGTYIQNAISMKSVLDQTQLIFTAQVESFDAEKRTAVLGMEKIAVCYWRLRLVLRCEMGEIRRGLYTASWRDTFRRIEQVEFEKRFIALQRSRQNLKHTSPGLQYLIGVLEEVRPEVEEVGYLSEEVLKRLTQHFGADEDGLAHWCWVFSQLATERLIEAGHASERKETPSPEQCKAIMLDLIEEEKKKLMNLKEILEENEQLELEATLASLYLPSREAVEKILRYETTIERQLYRAMSQLERLQRQRQGDLFQHPSV